MMRLGQYWLEVAMLAGVGVASVLSGIVPASRAEWLTKMFWEWGLVAILLVTCLPPTALRPTRQNPKSSPRNRGTTSTSNGFAATECQLHTTDIFQRTV